MKKIFYASAVMMAGATIFAQGTIIFNNRVAGFIVTHVYAPLPANLAFHQTGNGTADSHGTTNGIVFGTQDWSGFTLIGANGTGGQFGGASTFAQLLSASGYDQPEASLQPANPATTFRTGVAAGQVSAVTATLNNVFGTFYATIEMVAWDNSSGLYSSWTQASVAWQSGLIAAGESGAWNQNLSPPGSPAENLVNSTDGSQHLQSFNLYFIPEPSAFVLVSLGVAVLVLFGRKPKDFSIGL